MSWRQAKSGGVAREGGRRVGRAHWGAWLLVGVLFFPGLAQEQTAPVSSPISKQGQAGLGAGAAVRRLAPEQARALGRLRAGRGHAWTRRGAATAAAASSQASSQAWTSLGPQAVSTSQYGLVSGRVTALALDPSDATGNRLYVGTTGGGVWLSQNAATAAAGSVSFTPLTDDLAALNYKPDASISIGAVTVQPGGTRVVLAGTGDANDALDSYYGGGILRSADGGATWSLIRGTADGQYGFWGEGFAGFAWIVPGPGSSANPDTVVAAVSQAWGGVLADTTQPETSYEGLYYSTDAGQTWTLATITDGSGAVVQGPGATFDTPDGNAATAVVWNPVRQVFIAAVRYHGYYSSADGVTWTRLSAQPGTNLTARNCPPNPGTTGSPACPIFRGALAVNPQTGDTFAWTVDASNQDQGLWQDACQASTGQCAAAIAWGTQLNTAALETNTSLGAATIANGDYNLALAAGPAGQDTELLAGANDLWRCSLAMNCQWRNTTNAQTCMSAKVGGYQHAIEWNQQNPLEVMAGNDSGLWRSLDGIAQTGAVCSSADASHFDNLNGALGPLGEVGSLAGLASADATPYTLLSGMGATGAAGVKATEAVADWPQVLSGEGGPVAIDQEASPAIWYVNNAAGVSIHACQTAGACTGADFGATPAVGEADVSQDGAAMTTPAPFLVDAADRTELLVGTCRVWRGPATGNWSAANAISPILDRSSAAACDGDPLIRTLAALKTADGGEMIYAGMYGLNNGGGVLPGHIFRARWKAGVTPSWTDLTTNPVTGSATAFNAGESDIAGIYVDPHDATGMTVYVAVEGTGNGTIVGNQLYRSTDGGAHWQMVGSNLPVSPANAVVVDPVDAGTVYVGLDAGVFATQQIGNCVTTACWSALGSGLPAAPATTLRVAPVGAADAVLVAGTYGRGVWMTPLLTQGTKLTTATATPGSLTFTSQPVGTASTAQAVTVSNTGADSLLLAPVVASGDFTESDNCAGQTLAAGASCAVEVVFSPSATGARTGTLTVAGNLSGGNLTVSLSGVGAAAQAITVAPTSIAFGQVQVNTTSSPEQVTAKNTGAAAVSFTGVTATGAFAVATNACTGSLEPKHSCNVQVTFNPTAKGAATGTLSLVDSAGTQTVALSGTGASGPADALSPGSLSFPNTATGLQSASEPVALANGGGVALTGIQVSVSGPFTAKNNCGGELAAGSSCQIGVAFAPTAAGAQTGVLTVADQLHSQTVALNGKAIQNAAIGVSPASLSFSGQAVGQTSAAETLTVTNSGGLALAQVGFQVTGLSASQFSLTTNGCTGALKAGASCTVGVVFKPAAAGGATATLAVSSATAGVAAVAVPLNGSALSSTGLNLTPATVKFPIVLPGAASDPATVTVSNAGNTAATGLTVAASKPFVLVNNRCGTSLAAGAQCTLGVVFMPQVAGDYAAQLTVSSAASEAVVTLTGVGGTPGELTAGPRALEFGQMAVGLTSDPQKVTLTNPSLTTALTGLTLAASDGFKVDRTNCGTSLAAQSSCTVSVVFAPASAGTQTGTLTASSDALAHGAEVSLTGMGFDFAVAPKGAGSQSTVNGGTANYTLSITPLGGSQGAFQASCSGLPPYSACSFNPGTETIGANSTGTMLVQVATGLQTSAQARPVGGWPLAPVACGAVLAGLGLRRRRRALVLAGVLAWVVAGMTSCTASNGGFNGGGGKSGPGITPSGTYSIQVTVSANGISHRQKLTLVVE